MAKASLKDYCKILGSQSAVADIFGCSVQYISKEVNSKKEINIEYDDLTKKPINATVKTIKKWGKLC